MEWLKMPTCAGWWFEYDITCKLMRVVGVAKKVYPDGQEIFESIDAVSAGTIRLRDGLWYGPIPLPPKPPSPLTGK